jgi:hypothetical protein
MRQELQCVLDIVRIVPATDLPRLLGELEEVRTTGLARLTAPVPVEAPGDCNGEDVLDVAEAAAYIDMSAKWLYRHYTIIPHVRIGFGSKPRLKFRRRDLDAWLEQHRIKHGKH